ncbi:hypothetical protein V1508DRAFT_434148 [Lipomyces doorenjongii]|uniref:uncharacterized protein n=1 Tax=Lipomyces doorenjongii TaxID=383834 RepID=UPI0034CE2AAF
MTDTTDPFAPIDDWNEYLHHSARQLQWETVHDLALERGFNATTYMALAEYVLDKFSYCESAYGLFTRALELMTIDNGPWGLELDILARRSSVAVKSGHLHLALRDAIEMIRTWPSRDLGYVCAAKICGIMKDRNALEFVHHFYMTVGKGDDPEMQKILKPSWPPQETDGNSFPKSDRIHDPLTRLPPELVDHILGYLPYFRLYRLKSVSKSWQDVVAASLARRVSVDFTQLSWPIPFFRAQIILKQLRRVRSIVLCNIMYWGVNDCVTHVLGLDGDSQRYAYPDLEKLDIQMRTSVFRNTVGVEIPVFKNLKSLEICMADSVEVVQRLADGDLPMLKILSFYNRHDIVVPDNEIVYLNDSNAYAPHSSLRVLSIGTFIFNPENPATDYRYLQAPQRHRLSPRGLSRLLQILPHLSSLSCVMVNTSVGDSHFVGGINQQCKKFEFSKWTPKLKIINFFQSVIPQALRFTKSLNWVDVSYCTPITLPTCVMQNGVLSYADMNPGNDLGLVETDELSSVSSMRLSAVNLRGPKLIDFVARLNPMVLTHLYVNSIPPLNFGEQIDPSEAENGGSDFLAHPTSYRPGSNISYAGRPLKLIAQLCPNLRLLNISNSRSITDSTIRDLESMKSLEKVSIYRTSVTAAGVSYLLRTLPKLLRVEASLNEINMDDVELREGVDIVDGDTELVYYR